MFHNSAAQTHSLYIHWPFCPYRCHYCPFVALASHDSFMGRYHKALIKEIKEYGLEFTEKMPIDTIYFGGGTPSTYPDDLLLDTFGILRSIFSFDDKTEVTIEVNPGTVRSEQLPLWKELGINRMSVGVQSLNDDVLHKLNRLQKASDVRELLQKGPQYFDNISIDVILGLPGVSVEEWKALLAEVVTWDITHISMYILEVHDTTPLYFNIKTKKVTLPCEDDVIDLYYWSRDFLAQHGFMHYEISSFARNGKESRHNSVYWERKPYKGFGLGACSFDGIARLQNEKSLMKYIESCENGLYVPAYRETITEEQVYAEKVMLGLRRAKGVSWQEIDYYLTSEKREGFVTLVDVMKQKNLIEESDGYLRLTPSGLIVENEIITRLTL